MGKVVIAGGSGFLGQALAAPYLERWLGCDSFE